MKIYRLHNGKYRMVIWSKYASECWSKEFASYEAWGAFSIKVLGYVAKGE